MKDTSTTQTDTISAYYARDPQAEDYPPKQILTDQQIESLRLALAWLAGLTNKEVSQDAI